MYFLCDRKYQRAGQSCTAFGASFVQESPCDIFQSVHTSPLAACRNAWGGKNSLRSNIMPPVSKHCSAARCASQRCPPAVGGELPFARHFRTPIHRSCSSLFEHSSATVGAGSSRPTTADTPTVGTRHAVSALRAKRKMFRLRST